MSVITGAYGFQLRAPGVPLERVELPTLEPVDDQYCPHPPEAENGTGVALSLFIVRGRVPAATR